MEPPAEEEPRDTPDDPEAEAPALFERSDEAVFGVTDVPEAGLAPDKAVGPLLLLVRTGAAAVLR
jgi:hypothetical protein